MRHPLVYFVLATLLVGCGGGGGGSAPSGGAAGSQTVAIAAPSAGIQVPAEVPVPAPQASTPAPVVPPLPVLPRGCVRVDGTATSGDVALWGDSLAYRLHLATLGERTVYTGAADGWPSYDMARRIMGDGTHRPWVHVLWLGTANRLARGAFRPSDADQVKSDLANVVACIEATHNRFVVLPVMNISDITNRTEEYQVIMQLNAELSATYPDNYLDIRSILIEHADLTSSRDRADVANDVVPTSLRVDGIHLNAAGVRIVAERLQEFMDSRGW